jgi:cytochrome c oxidase cbb3-type subunit 2
MKYEMTPRVIGIGTLVVFSFIVFAVVIVPTLEEPLTPSDTWRSRTEIENRGLQIFIANGCQYCHSQYVRPQDWDYGSDRVAQAGDYVEDTPPLLGSERQGPDLSQEGGLRADDWHHAHFTNPRFTRPDSIMPVFEWLGDQRIRELTAYIQSRGGTDADARLERQRFWKGLLTEAYKRGPIENMQFLHDNIPAEWVKLPNPYPATETALKRGERIFFQFCIGCHGPVGDGRGPAALYLDPQPFNFTYLNRWKASTNLPIGGILYYQVMNGITGSAMPPFKTELESEKIWDVSNYVAVYFTGGADVLDTDRGIPASFEPKQQYEDKQREEKAGKTGGPN